ncbi:hypothetical protein Droror1_Dr00003127 [Drosera rotundifolia]
MSSSNLSSCACLLCHEHGLLIKVLTDPQKPAAYDQYGEEGLHGVSRSDHAGRNGSTTSRFDARSAESNMQRFLEAPTAPFHFRPLHWCDEGLCQCCSRRRTD